MNKKGFTLMEVLAVLLVVALVASMAVPAFRYIRREMRYNQARAAAVKLAEALRTYYQQTRGHRMADGCFQADTETSVLYATVCSNWASVGVPGNHAGETDELDGLFACGYLNPRDFAGLPYLFCACNDDGDSCDEHSDWLVRVTPTSNAGSDYQGREIGVTKSMQLVEADID